MIRTKKNHLFWNFELFMHWMQRSAIGLDEIVCNANEIAIAMRNKISFKNTFTLTFLAFSFVGISELLAMLTLTSTESQHFGQHCIQCACSKVSNQFRWNRISNNICSTDL